MVLHHCMARQISWTECRAIKKRPQIDENLNYNEDGISNHWGDLILNNWVLRQIVSLIHVSHQNKFQMYQRFR